MDIKLKEDQIRELELKVQVGLFKYCSIKMTATSVYVCILLCPSLSVFTLMLTLVFWLVFHHPIRFENLKRLLQFCVFCCFCFPQCISVD